MKYASQKNLGLDTITGLALDKEKGFSFVELIVVVSVMAILFGFVTINLLGTQQHVSLVNIASSIESDIKSQQLKAMEGATSGGSAYGYGVYVSSHSYTLFRGTVYSASDPTNAVVQVDTEVTLSTTLPSATISFSQGSGAIPGFVSGNNTITMTDTNNNQTRTLTFNRYGVVTSIQ